MIPDMTTGMRHFMIRSGRKVPTPAMPMPDLAVPYAAPAPGGNVCQLRAWRDEV